MRTFDEIANEICGPLSSSNPPGAVMARDTASLSTAKRGMALVWHYLSQIPTLVVERVSVIVSLVSNYRISEAEVPCCNDTNIDFHDVVIFLILSNVKLWR